jgi:hypothetical protein
MLNTVKLPRRVCVRTRGARGTSHDSGQVEKSLSFFSFFFFFYYYYSLLSHARTHTRTQCIRNIWCLLCAVCATCLDRVWTCVRDWKTISGPEWSRYALSIEEVDALGRRSQLARRSHTRRRTARDRPRSGIVNAAIFGETFPRARPRHATQKKI